MPLDSEFKQQTERLVSETLQLYKTAGASPRIGDVWKCENTGDFLCGFFVGEMVGSALSAFQVFHKREPTPEEHMEIVDIVEENQGKAILTKNEHPSGSDRVYEAYLKELKGKVDFIINLQGDSPIMSPNSILKLEKLMKDNVCDIGTLASHIKDKDEVSNPNVVNTARGASSMHSSTERNEQLSMHPGIFAGSPPPSKKQSNRQPLPRPPFAVGSSPET